MQRVRSRLLLSFIISGFIFVFNPAFASQVKKVESLTTYFSEPDTEILTSLKDSVNILNTFILQTQSGDFFTTQLKDEKTILAVRESSNLKLEGKVKNYAVEFVSGLKVLKGITKISPDIYIKDIVLPQTIDPKKSFPLITVRANLMPAESEAKFFKTSFLDANTLRLERLDIPAKGGDRIKLPDVYVTWQVIEMEEASAVKSGVITIPYNGAEAVVDLSKDPLKDVDKTFLIFNYSAGAAIEGKPELLMLKGTVAGKDTLVFSRAAKGEAAEQNIEIAWYAVELLDEVSNVQKGAVKIGRGSESIEVKLKYPVDQKRAFPIISVSASRATGAALTDCLVAAELSGRVTKVDRLALTRVNTANELNLNWFVVELSPISLKLPEKETWQVGQDYPINWHHAESLEKDGRGIDGHHLVDILLSLLAV